MASLFALVVAALAAYPGFRSGRRLWHAGAGVGLVVAALVLLSATDRGFITVLVGAVGGLGAGLALSWFRRDEPSGQPATGRHGAGALVVGGVAAAVGLLLWVGANDPAVGWFGRVHVHGPRDVDEVALTFDDGPDADWSLAVADILDERGAKGTFFEVGKAVDARPHVARRLHERGHLLGNHSYHHDYWRWLDPRYPELDRAQDAFRRQVGVCPALFRPPHGQRTPFMLRRAADRGLATITWDVSANDWSEDDGRRVAERVLDRVEPGSIVLLHDGLDGATGADRSVLQTALPLILEGLEEQGLTPVRLDELLDLPGYQACSSP